MNQLQVFQSSEFGKLEVLMIDGKEHFPATACARLLGYERPADAIAAHCKGSVKHRLPTNGGNQEVKFISEGDLYRLIIRSKLPGAERFERWVFDEVLPSIRKTGHHGNFSMEQLAQVIQMTATAVASEMIKQIAPLIQQPMAQTTINVGESTPNRSRRRNGKVDLLPRMLRDVVDSMLLSNMTYLAIVEHLDYSGYPMSQMAINNYYRRGVGEGRF